MRKNRLLGLPEKPGDTVTRWLKEHKKTGRKISSLERYKGQSEREAERRGLTLKVHIAKAELDHIYKTFEWKSRMDMDIALARIFDRAAKNHQALEMLVDKLG